MIKLAINDKDDKKEHSDVYKGIWIKVKHQPLDVLQPFLISISRENRTIDVTKGILFLDIPHVVQTVQHAIDCIVHI